MQIITYKELKNLNSSNLLNIEKHQKRLKKDYDAILVDYDAILIDNEKKIEMQQSLQIVFGYIISFKNCGGWSGTKYISHLGYSNPIKERRNSSQDFYFSPVEYCINYINDKKEKDWKLTIYISPTTLKNDEFIKINGPDEVDLIDANAVKVDVIDKIYRYFGFRLSSNNICVDYSGK